jgi:hypothetical protein
MIYSNIRNINSKYIKKSNYIKQFGSAEDDEIEDEIYEETEESQSTIEELEESSIEEPVGEVLEEPVLEEDVVVEEVNKYSEIEEPEYTILDELIKKNKQFIILVMGLPCTSKSELAKELVVDLGLPIINISDYLIQDKYIDKEVDGVKFKLYEHPDNYDWDKLNYDINRLKRKGVIIYGNYLDFEKIKWTADVVYFVSMNLNLCKDKLIEKKLLPYESDDSKISLYFTKIFNPIYDEIKNKVKINKFFNIKENTTFDDIYNELFDNLILLVKSKLKKFNSK